MQRMAKHADLICASFTLRFFGSLGFSRFLTGCHYGQQLIFRKSKDLTNRRAGDRVVDIGDVHKNRKALTGKGWYLCRFNGPGWRDLIDKISRFDMYMYRYKIEQFQRF